MAKRSSGSNRKTRGESITAYVFPAVKRQLKKLTVLVADDIDRERLLEIGVLTAYAVQYLLTVPIEEALRILKAGKAYEESHDPDAPAEPPAAKKPTGGRDKGSSPKFGTRKAIPAKIASGSVRGTIGNGPALGILDHAPFGQVIDPC